MHNQTCLAEFLWLIVENFPLREFPNENCARERLD